MLDLQRIQNKVEETKTGCTLYPELRDKERRYPWCSTRQDRGTKIIPPSLECVEEMLQRKSTPKVFTGIHDRFLRDPVYRESQLAIGWTDQECKEWDELVAKEDHTYKLTPEEKRRYKGHWYLTLNKTGKNGPVKLRSDYRAAVTMKNRYTTNHENQLKSPSIQVSKDAYDEDKTFSQKITCPALELINIHDGNIALQLQVPRGGTNPNGVGSELTIFFCSTLSLFCYSWFRLQSIAIHCNRRVV